MKDTSLNLLRPNDLIALQKEREQIDEKLHGPWKHLIQFPGTLHQRLRDINKQLQQYAPEPITDPRERDRLAKRERELREELTSGMLTAEEMRKNPPGASDYHRAWERHNKSKIMEWKNHRLQLAADTSDPDTWNRDEANLERYRPVGATGRVRLDAQIPGKMAMSPEAKEHWPLGEPTVETAAKQATKRVVSDSEKAMLRDRLSKARAAKATKRATSVTADETT